MDGGLCPCGQHRCRQDKHSPVSVDTTNTPFSTVRSWNRETEWSDRNPACWSGAAIDRRFTLCEFQEFSTVSRVQASEASGLIKPTLWPVHTPAVTQQRGLRDARTSRQIPASLAGQSQPRATWLRAPVSSNRRTLTPEIPGWTCAAPPGLRLLAAPPQSKHSAHSPGNLAPTWANKAGVAKNAAWLSGMSNSLLTRHLSLCRAGGSCSWQPQ